MWLLALTALAAAGEPPEAGPVAAPPPVAGPEAPPPVEWPAPPPEGPGPALVFDEAPVMLALDRAHHRRTLESVVALAGVAAVEVGVGLLVGGATDRGDGLGGLEGFALAGVGVVHAVDAGFQIDAARRQRRAFLASAALREHRGAAAWRELARHERSLAESRSRNHALLTGLYAGLAAGGAAFTVADPNDDGMIGPGVAAAFGGFVGVLHHVVRWRQEVRYAADLDTLSARMPPSPLDRAPGF